MQYRNFAAEFARLQAERAAAFSEFADDVKTGAYPGPGHRVAIDDAEYAAFLAALDAR